MTITLVGYGNVQIGSTLVTAISAAQPAGVVSGDLCVIGVEAKPDTTGITTPASWNKIGEWTGGVGAQGVDTGATKSALYWRTDAPPGPTPITQSGASSMMAGAFALRKDYAGSWDVSTFTSGADTTHAVNYSATSAANVLVNPNNWVVAFSAMTSDAGSYTSDALTATGITFGVATMFGARPVSNGDDSYYRVIGFEVLAGTGTVALTYSITTTAANSGHTAFLVVREPASASRPMVMTY